MKAVFNGEIVERQSIKLMENQFYQMYLDELSEIPECTNEEMEALLNSLPNEEAVKRLTEGSLAYVVREAAKYAGNDVEISDLVQEGNMALLLVLKKLCVASSCR